MKKILTFILVGVIYLNACGPQHKVFPTGKDTVVSYGDGTFEIGRAGIHNSLYLFNNKAKVPGVSVDTVKKYKNIGNMVYVIGGKAFYVLDIKNNKMLMKKKISDFPEKVQRIFKEMKK